MWNRAWWMKGCAGGYALSDLPSIKEQEEAERLDIKDWEREEKRKKKFCPACGKRK